MIDLRNICVCIYVICRSVTNKHQNIAVYINSLKRWQFASNVDDTIHIGDTVSYLKQYDKIVE